ncbi:MAG: hypothetical protein KJ821_04015, partial [Actinobacteria bacterium]|nr:hypothetical protein [Actinomycetota bacterium]
MACLPKLSPPYLPFTYINLVSREGFVLSSHFRSLQRRGLPSVRPFESCKHAPMACLPKLSPPYLPFTYINLVSREGFVLS